MSTTTTTQKNATSKNGKVQEKKQESKDVQNAKKEISQILEPAKNDVKQSIVKPNAKSRISKLETLNILADKHKKISEKYDELTNFVASNDGTSATMRFSAENNYSFNVSSPAVINKVLLVIEKELSETLEKAENEVLTFSI